MLCDYFDFPKRSGVETVFNRLTVKHKVFAAFRAFRAADFLVSSLFLVFWG